MSMSGETMNSISLVPPCLAAVGDAPLGYGRWRFETGPTAPAGQQGQGQQQYAMVDRLCVLKEYRLRGFAKACLERIVHDVSTQTAQVRYGRVSRENVFWFVKVP